MEHESSKVFGWSEFSDLAKNTFKDLLSDQNFIDVTLANEDNKLINAHKVILSACHLHQWPPPSSAVSERSGQQVPGLPPAEHVPGQGAGSGGQPSGLHEGSKRPQGVRA